MSSAKAGLQLHTHELPGMGKLQSNSKAASPWIYNPALDLIVGCGAWSAPLLLFSYVSLTSSARTWSVVFYVLALFFNYPHYMATIYRAYHRAEDFHKYRIFTVHTTGLIVLTLLLAHYWVGLLPWIFTIYLTWSPWHYSGQNYGLFMMFARRAGAQPDQTTRRALYGAFIASYLILFLGFHTGASNDPLFVSIGIPAVISRWEQAILGCAFMVLSIFGFARLSRGVEWKRLIPCLTLFSSQFLWFFLPSAISLFRGLAVPQNRYSTGVLAVMHSAQYLWITSYYARREAVTDESGRERSGWKPLAYFGVLILGGIALFVPGPWMASRILHQDFTASFLIFTALVNIHHFILDGAIWKLRDGRIASLLLNSRERIADAAADAGGRLMAGARWLVGNSASARVLRVTMALLLLTWGTVDQVRYYFALHTDDLADLRRAAALDGFDSALQMRLARRAMADGDPTEAEAAWRRAIEANPKDPAARQGLLQLLITQDRYQDALSLTETSLRYAPKDANLLVDRGFLKLQEGHAADARVDWEQAIEIDPGQMNAHLYLADELDREGNAAVAAAHYGVYLEKIAHQRTQDRPAPEKVIALVLRMADCQTRASQSDLALKSYHLAEKLAVETRQPKMQSLADVNEAALQIKLKHWSEALPLYQEALRLDGANADESASGDDWFAFGRFLDEAGFQPRFAYACIVKSEQIKQLLHGASQDEATQTLDQSLQKKLRSAATSIRRDPDPLLSQALELRP